MKTFLTLALSGIVTLSFAQDKVLDALADSLKVHSEADTIRIEHLLNISRHLLSTSEQSKQYIQEAISLSEQIGFEKGIAESRSYMAHYHWYRSQYALAVEQALAALRIHEKLKDTNGLFESNLTLAGIYMSWKDFKSANEFMDVTIALADQIKDNINLGDFYHKVAFFKLQQDQTKEGIAFIKKSLDIKQKSHDLYGQASCYFLLAKAHMALRQEDAARSDYETSVRLAWKSTHPNALSNILACHEGLGELHVRQNNFDQAQVHLDSALAIAKKVNGANMLMRIYNDHAKLNEAQGKFKEALRYERLNRKLSDSLINVETSRQVAEAQSKYEAEKKDQAIALLQEKDNVHTLWRNSLAIGLLLVTGAALIIYLLQRSRARNARKLLDTQKKLNEQMYEADKLKSRFFAHISHEFRTPLTLILSPVEDRLATQGLTQKETIVFQSIQRSASRLLELINQLLELSKIESGFMKLRQDPGSLFGFLMPILTSFDSLAEVHRINYVKEVRVSEVVVLFDADKLEKILINLLSNAFKFSPGGERVMVRINTQESENNMNVTIEVVNRAIIPEGDIGKIFDPFFQGSDVSQRSAGTGLGLALVNELIKLHHGSIVVTSTEETGTMFSVALSFPLSSDATKAFPPTAAPYDSALEKMMPDDSTEAIADVDTILVVEDNAEVRNLICAGLRPEYNVVEATTGKEGLELAKVKEIDLIVSDVMMPLLDGLALCHRLKNDEVTSHIPVILLTARADHESKLEGLRTGADDYIVKPFNMQELLARIANLIAQRKKLIRKFNTSIVIKPHEITVTSIDEQFFQKVISVMEENLENSEFNVDAMTTQLGTSRTNLHRKLKSITGLATNEFIQDFRLRRAAILLEKKADTIAQIAYRVGFADQSYFSKCFRKKFGKTPSEYAPDPLKQD